jgi:hypothetical protein
VTRSGEIPALALALAFVAAVVVVAAVAVADVLLNCHSEQREESASCSRSERPFCLTATKPLSSPPKHHTVVPAGSAAKKKVTKLTSEPISTGLSDQRRQADVSVPISKEFGNS